MKLPVSTTYAIALTTLLSVVSAHAADMPRSGFFDSYSNLQPVGGSQVSFLYTSDELEEVLSTTRAVVVLQPEIFLSDDSKYKGISPDEMKALADSFQSIIVDTLSDKYQIARSPGPNTIVVRMALSNIHLQRKGRKFFQYLPVGLVLTTAKRAMDEFTQKVVLTEVSWEAEILGDGDADVLAQLLVPMGNHSKKKEFSSWNDLIVAMSVGGLRLRCRLDNAAASTADTDHCLEITEADLPEL